MPSSPWNLSLALLLIALGAIFAWYEQRTIQLLPNFSARIRPLFVERSRRRLRVATLITMIGVLMVCGHWTDPQLHPIRFLIIGLLTTIFSLALLVYGIADFRATRLHRIEAGKRSLARLAETREPFPASLEAAPPDSQPIRHSEGRELPPTPRDD